ncbi:DUF4352 domain-containing protein [Rummeliibacillus pycnus]|uniref:DUF4352 domain-containing protein n=1 Tax=Rummeliibacillus pycnus TaxID=101070 RepID=UPI0037CA8A74
MKKKLRYIAPMILALFLSACGDTKVKKEEADSSTKTEQKAEKKEKKKNKTYKVGETVKVNDVKITITKAKIVKPDKNIKPQNGKVLQLNITVKNSSKNKVYVDSSHFTLLKGGKSQDEYYGGKTPISGDINKGEKLSGIIKYDVSKKGTYKLIYTPTFSLDHKEIKWKIDVK